MQKRLVLHIGAPKTGTTAIQDYLASNGTTLAAHRAHYAFAARQHQGHHPLLRAAPDRYRNHECDWIQQPAADMLERLNEEIRACGQCDDFILSSEALFYLKSPASLLNAIDTAGFDEILVVLYLRNPLPWFWSLYLQCAKFGYAAAGFAEFFSENYHEYCDYPRLLSRWRAASTKVRVQAIAYEDAIRRHGGAVQSFLSDVLRWPEPLTQENLAINPSLSPPLALCLQRLLLDNPDLAPEARETIVNLAESAAHLVPEGKSSSCQWQPPIAASTFLQEQTDWLAATEGVALDASGMLAMPAPPDAATEARVYAKLLVSLAENFRFKQHVVSQGIIATDIRFIDFADQFERTTPIVVAGEIPFVYPACRTLTRLGFSDVVPCALREGVTRLAMHPKIACQLAKPGCLTFIAAIERYFDLRSQLIIEFGVAEQAIY